MFFKALKILVITLYLSQGMSNDDSPKSSNSMNYYDWKHNQQTCGNCKWTGVGEDAKMGDSFDDGAEYHCPKCNHYFGFIAYPLIEESLSDPRADPADRMFAEIVMRRTKEVKDQKKS